MHLFFVGVEGVARGLRIYRVLIIYLRVLPANKVATGRLIADERVEGPVVALAALGALFDPIGVLLGCVYYESVDLLLL